MERTLTQTHAAVFPTPGSRLPAREWLCQVSLTEFGGAGSGELLLPSSSRSG